MKIRELLEGSNWDTFKQSVKTGYEKAEKTKRNIKRHPITKAIKGIAKFAQDINRGPGR